jgi:hypothetical protein
MSGGGSIQKEQVMRIGITALALTAAVALSVSGTVVPAAAAPGGVTATTAIEKSGAAVSARVHNPRCVATRGGE